MPHKSSTRAGRAARFLAYPRSQCQEPQIDYRHVIDSLVRKPGAFARYLYREELFPRPTFRQAYDRLKAAEDGKASARYVQHSREEMEVLFQFLAERYENKSVVITSNLVFSQWDQIFKDPMTTMAAVDRLVHHATILEFTGDSQRGPKKRSD